MNENATAESGLDIKDRIREEDAVTMARALLAGGHVQLETTLDIFGTEFKLVALTASETDECTLVTNGLDLLTRDGILQKEILSRSLVSIGGHPMDRNAARAFLNELPPTGVVRIYNTYLEMVNTQNTRFGDVEDATKK